MPIYVVPKALRERLGEEATEALVQFLREVSEHNRADLLALAEERLERRLAEAAATIRSEIAATRAELLEVIANARTEFRQAIADARAESREGMANLRADLVRWMFMFWVGQLAVLVGILLAWFRR